MKPGQKVGEVVWHESTSVPEDDGERSAGVSFEELTPEVQALIETGEKAAQPVIGLDRERLLEWAEENLDDFDYTQLAGEMAVGKFDLPATPVEPQGIPPCAECGSPTESGLCYHADKCSYKPTVATEPPKETCPECAPHKFHAGSLCWRKGCECHGKAPKPTVCRKCGYEESNERHYRPDAPESIPGDHPFESADISHGTKGEGK